MHTSPERSGAHSGSTVELIRNNMRLSSCTSVRSITLPVTIVPGNPAAMRRQWQLNLALLGDLPPSTMHRVHLCFLYDKHAAIGRMIEQVKQLDWKALYRVLSRFSVLEKVAVTADNGVGDRESEVLQEVIRLLQCALSSRGGVRVIPCYDYVL
jgi:hypothetical protein